MDMRTLAGLLIETYRFRQHDRGRRPQLKLYQTRALYRLRAHAYARSPFYGRFHKNLIDRHFVSCQCSPGICSHSTSMNW